MSDKVSVGLLRVGPATYVACPNCAIQKKRCEVCIISNTPMLMFTIFELQELYKGIDFNVPVAEGGKVVFSPSCRSCYDGLSPCPRCLLKFAPEQAHVMYPIEKEYPRLILIKPVVRSDTTSKLEKLSKPDKLLCAINKFMDWVCRTKPKTQKNLKSQGNTSSQTKGKVTEPVTGMVWSASELPPASTVHTKRSSGTVQNDTNRVWVW